MDRQNEPQVQAVSFDKIIVDNLKFTSAELAVLFDCYVKNATVYRLVLADIFSCYFPQREEPYTVEDIFGIYLRGGLEFEWQLRRLNPSLYLGNSIREYAIGNKILDKREDYKALIAKLLEYHSAHNLKKTGEHEGLTIEDLQLSGCIPTEQMYLEGLENYRYEIDYIRDVISVFYTLVAEMALNMYARSYPKAGLADSLPTIKGWSQRVYSKFVPLRKNQKNIKATVKKDLLAHIESNDQRKDRIAEIYITKGPVLFLVKDLIIGSFMNRYDADMSISDFDRWKKSVSNAVDTFMSILLPKWDTCFKLLDKRKGLLDKTRMAEKIVGYFNLVHAVVYQEDSQIQKSNEDKTTATEPFNKDDLCGSCKAFHEYLERDDNRNQPHIAECIMLCNKERAHRLNTLKSYFSLGSIKASSEFAKFLKKNLRRLGKADAVFKGKTVYKQFKDVYYRGIWRFFWDPQTLEDLEPLYTEYEHYNNTELFSIDNSGIPKLCYEHIRVSITWPGIRPFRKLRYKPKRKAAIDNYENVLKAMFGDNEVIELNDEVKIETCQILPLMMFFYWIYLAQYSKHKNAIRKLSRCVFHKVFLQ